MNCKGFERKRLDLIDILLTHFFWMNWGKLRRPSVRVAVSPAGIRTKHLPNWSLERYRYANQLGLELKNIVANIPVTQSQSQSHIATDGQSVCLSWCRAPSGAHDQILITVWQLLSCPWEGALSDERTGLSCVSQSAVLGPLSVCTFFYIYMCHMLLNTYTIYTRSLVSPG
jgi:hypothetical protein